MLIRRSYFIRNGKELFDQIVEYIKFYFEISDICDDKDCILVGVNIDNLKKRLTLESLDYIRCNYRNCLFYIYIPCKDSIYNKIERGIREIYFLPSDDISGISRSYKLLPEFVTFEYKDYKLKDCLIDQFLFNNPKTNVNYLRVKMMIR